MPTEPLPSRLTIDEVALLARRHRSTVMDWVQTGFLVPAPKFPGVRGHRFAREHVDEVLRRHAEGDHGRLQPLRPHRHRKEMKKSIARQMASVPQYRDRDTDGRV